MALLLASNGFNPSYAYLNNKYENRLNAQFATIDIMSNKAIGKAVSSDGSVFEEYELEVKISMYFKPSENVNTVQTLSDNMLQRFYPAGSPVVLLSVNTACFLLIATFVSIVPV